MLLLGAEHQESNANQNYLQKKQLALYHLVKEFHLYQIYTFWFSLSEKALDEKGKRLFADGDRAALRREVNAATLQEIQLEMLNSGAENKVEEVKAEMKSEG